LVSCSDVHAASGGTTTRGASSIDLNRTSESVSLAPEDLLERNGPRELSIASANYFKRKRVELITNHFYRPPFGSSLVEASL
jgi:hypothetical protein